MNGAKQAVVDETHLRHLLRGRRRPGRADHRRDHCADSLSAKALPVNFYPTKGMAQRGGFVKAQLRLGRARRRAGLSRKRARTW